MRGKGILLAGALAATTGCYAYLPSTPEQVGPGTPVRVRLTADEAGRLVDQRLTDARLLTGTLVEADGEQLLIDTSVGQNDAQRGMHSVVQRVAVPRGAVLEMERRELDKERTGLVVGIGTVALGVLVALQTSGNQGTPDGPGGGTQESRRLPILSFRIFW